MSRNLAVKSAELQTRPSLIENSIKAVKGVKRAKDTAEILDSIVKSARAFPLR